jgi:tRNA(Ile)-lysidine synthase
MIARRLGHLSADSGVLVAWSGGLDSTVLLHLLREWAHRTGAELAAVHVDHQLRASSAVDQAFCRRLAHRWGIPLVVQALDLRQRGSLQESARVQRYAAIAQAAQSLGLGQVATAHHADDAVETALLNFRRGTSSGGLSSGISPAQIPTPSWPDLEIVRPLAEAPKRELVAYADSHHIEWQVDPTNAQAGYERNRLRQQVLPALTDDGELLAPMLDTLENLASERRAIDALAEDCLARALMVAPDSESLALECESLRDVPEAVIALALQKLACLLPEEVGFGRDHLNQIIEGITKLGTVTVAIRGGLASIERGVLVVEIARGRGGRHLKERVAQPIELGELPPRAGVAAHDQETAHSGVPWFGSRLHCETMDADAQENRTWPEIIVRADSARGPFVIRGPRPGDRVDAQAMQGHKSVSDVLAEAGVPRALRWRWPLVARDHHTQDVEWICGLRRAEPDPTISPEQPRVRLFWEVAPSSIFAKLLPASRLIDRRI